MDNIKIETKTYPSSILNDRGNYNLLITYEEVKKYIVDQFDNNIKNENTTTKDTLAINEKLEENITELLKLPIYKNLSNNTTLNSLKYLFFHLRNAIYVKIRDNKVIMFQPFANALYKNNWSHNIILDNGTDNKDKSDKTNIYLYIKNKEKEFKIYQKYIMNKEEWWCNNILINTEKRADVWGTHSLDLYKEILDETCKTHKINNVDFFLNKRDHPLLKKFN